MLARLLACSPASGPRLRRNGGLYLGGADGTASGPLLGIGNVQIGRAAKRRPAGISTHYTCIMYVLYILWRRRDKNVLVPRTYVRKESRCNLCIALKRITGRRSTKTRVHSCRAEAFRI